MLPAGGAASTGAEPPVGGGKFEKSERLPTQVPMEEVREFLAAKPALVYHVQTDLANSFSIELKGRVTIPALVLRDTAANCCVVSESFLRGIGFVRLGTNFWVPRRNFYGRNGIPNWPYSARCDEGSAEEGYRARDVHFT